MEKGCVDNHREFSALFTGWFEAIKSQFGNCKIAVLYHLTSFFKITFWLHKKQEWIFSLVVYF